MGKIIESKIWVAELWERGVPELRLPRDRRLYCPSFDWLKEYCDWLSKNRVKWLREKYDCDEQVYRGMYFAHESLRRNEQVDGAGAAFAWSEIDLTDGILLNVSGGGHVNMLVRCDNDLSFFVEPQNGGYEEFTGPTNDYPAPSYVRV